VAPNKKTTVITQMQRVKKRKKKPNKNMETRINHPTLIRNT